MWVTSIIRIYQGIKVIFNVLLKFIFGAVPEIQIGDALCVIGLPPPQPPYVYCVYNMLRYGVLGPLTAFEDDPI